MNKKIEDLISQRSVLEKNYKLERESIDKSIVATIENSEAYKRLKIECTGKYKCYVSVLDGICVHIYESIGNVPSMNFVDVYKNEVQSSLISGSGMSYIKEKINTMAINFKRDFWDKED